MRDKPQLEIKWNDLVENAYQTCEASVREKADWHMDLQDLPWHFQNYTLQPKKKNTKIS